jgi:putative transposase
MSKPCKTKPEVPLPRDWPKTVKNAMLHVIGLARYATAYTRGWAADSPSARVRLKAENDRLKEELQLLREEMRVKDARMATLDPHHRPRYPPRERMAILELKAARHWSLEQAARAFQVTAATVASWMKRLDEDGPDALVQLPTPVNKYPDFAAHCVRRLKALCPALGKVKIAQSFARAGLHLGATTVGRMLAGGTGRTAAADNRVPAADGQPETEPKVVTAKRPNHVWHVDLTVVPTALGFCCAWFPKALPQRWPFCYWVSVVVDHFSRRAMGVTTAKNQPTSADVRAFLGRSIARAAQTPKYIICDRGPQFDCAGFRDWCRRKGIKPPRYGAVGKHGSIAVVERFILTLKCVLGCLLLIPYKREAFQRELAAIVQWYNGHRPHTWLRGKTPDEVYHGAFAANRKPRFEPRARWPRGSPCARPWALVRGRPGAAFDLKVTFLNGRKHLPLVSLLRVA